jgi:hypothetical protein
MVTGRTLFPHRYICEGTWQGPDDRTVNQINHVMIDHRHHSNVLDVGSYRCANADSYHHLVIAHLRCCIAQRNNQNTPKARLNYNKERLEIKEVKQEYAK